MWLVVSVCSGDRFSMAEACQRQDSDFHMFVIEYRKKLVSWRLIIAGERCTIKIVTAKLTGRRE